MKKNIFLIFGLTFCCINLVMAGTPAQPAFFLAIKVTPTITVNMTGQKQQNQTIFYNVTDSAGKILVENTPINSDVITFANPYELHDATDQVNRESDFILTIYGVQAILPANQAIINAAIPIKLNVTFSSLYGAYYTGNFSEHWSVHGSVNATATVNKHFIHTFTQDQSNYWKEALNGNISTKPERVMNVDDTFNLNVTVPYTMPFASVSDSIMPDIQTLKNTFPE